MRLITARKDHWCSLCNRKIPKGHRYWQHYVNEAGETAFDRKEHTNCLEYEQEELNNATQLR